MHRAVDLDHYVQEQYSMYNTNVITFTEKEKDTISERRTTKDGGKYNHYNYRLFLVRHLVCIML